MLLISPPVPSICITPAPPEEIYPDPYSPFPPAKSQRKDDGYRAHWLSLPPSAASSPWHSSPLQPADRPSHKGVSRDQFGLLLRISRDQRAKFGSQKAPDLRKELALKNQNSKQLERRARFLSKINEVSHTTTPSTPEIALGSPMTAVVSLADKLGCDEQVGLIKEQPYLPAVPNKSRHVPPSLDEITAHLKWVHASFQDCSRSRLPNFLTALSLSSGSTDDQSRTFPVRSLALNDSMFVRQVIPPQRPDPTLGSKCVDISHTVNPVTGPMLHARRVDTARDMIVTPGRRSSPPPGLGGQVGLERVALSPGGY